MNKTSNRNTEAQMRRKHARALLDEYQNDWDGSDDLDGLIQHQWAIVTKREYDAWVNGIDSHTEIAEYILGTFFTDSSDTEWIDGVYDLDTGKPVQFSTETTVVVRTDAGTFRASSS